jgi:adenylate cyclase
MVESSLTAQIDDWLIEQSLGEPDIVELFEGVCYRLAAIGTPIGRAVLMWSTLHPLFQAEMVLWRKGRQAELDQFVHQDQVSEQWLRSPMQFMLKSGVDVLRRRLTGPAKLIDFPILDDLLNEGFSDYLMLSTGLFPTAPHGNDLQRGIRQRGIFVSWAADRPDGFTNEDVATLQHLQRGLAVACKTVIQTRIARNISEAYLGRQTGDRVLNGLIRLGEGEQTRALVWYSDLRSSTRLAETMQSTDFLQLLNAYFECAARPAIAAGGEVLAFVGDAVLAIFPVNDMAELPVLARRVLAALRVSLMVADKLNAERRQAGLETISYGIGLNVGSVMYGNIGVPERLAFSAIGPTVIEVARIEKLTKVLDARVLATREIAELEPRLWRSMGEHSLDGFGRAQEIYGFLERATEAA